MVVEVEARGQVEEFLDVLGRRRWQIVIPAAFVLAFGIAFATIVPKKIVVSTRVELKESFVGRGTWSEDPVEAATAREIGNVENHVKHTGRIRSVIEEQGDLWAEYVELDDVGRYDYVRTVRRNIGVTILEKTKAEGSTFLEISYADVDGARAEHFLNRLREVWIQDVVERDRQRVTRERDILQNRVEDSESTWKDHNQNFFELAKEMGIDPSQPISSSVQREEDPVYRELLDLQTRRDGAEADHLTAQEELTDLRRMWEEEPPEIEKEVSEAGFTADDEVLALELDIERLRGEQEGMRPANSQHRAIEREIRKLEARIEKARTLEREGTVRTDWVHNTRKDELATAVDVKEAAVRALGQRFRTLDEQLRRKRQEQDKRVDDYHDLFALAADRSDAESIMTIAREALAEKVTLLELMDKAYGRPFEIVEMPQAAGSPSEPNPWVIVAFTLVGGLALGLVLSLATEYGGNSFRTVADVSRLMTVPVLGVVSTILTRADRRRYRARRALVALSSLVVIAGILALTWTWANRPDTLPLGLQRAIDDLRMQLR